MSAPGPEKWMPSSFEILLSLKDLTVDSLSQSVQAPRLTALVKKAARRRAIEELKALVSGHCTYCALGFELLVPSGGDDGYHMVGPEGSRCQQRCDAYGIIYRIAAIEAEEA